ncbi:BTAD domain-containing putative transcriptional regulator [Arthrobacter cavernae]|nr:BTAD domain-containing putative transcriptional regulator [Arthrobacter cavernae]
MVDLDLDRFEALTNRAAHAEARQALALLTQALDLSVAPLLGDELLPAWADEERALHATRVSQTRVLAAETALSLGEVEKAIAWGGAAVNEDPLNERAWTALILGLEEHGESTEALRAFERCRRVMDQEMGCAPGPLLKAAQARLLERTAAHPEPSTAGVTAAVTLADHTIVPGHASQVEADRLRILTVDDHTTFTELLTGALDREPDLMSVGAAKSVESAVEMFRELRPDLVIMDLHLPDGSGLKAAELILSEAPEARIVILTGNPSAEALREAATIGVCAFLPKDGALGTMLDTLRHARTGTIIVHPSLVVQLGRGTPAVRLPSE